MNRLSRKFNTAKDYIPKPVVVYESAAKVGLIAFGSSDVAIIESRDQLKQANLKTGYFRLRALPFTKELREFVQKHETIYVIEQNRDGQFKRFDPFRITRFSYENTLHSAL